MMERTITYINCSIKKAIITHTHTHTHKHTHTHTQKGFCKKPTKRLELCLKVLILT